MQRDAGCSQPMTVLVGTETARVCAWDLPVLGAGSAAITAKATKGRSKNFVFGINMFATFG
jgi:hypothetical protein